MVTGGSTAMRCTTEFGKIISQHFDVFPPRIYACTDGGSERKVDNLSVQKSYISIFPSYDIDEILVVRKAANLSFWNPVERCYAVTNQGFQIIGVMRKPMASEMDNYIKNANGNEGIRKLCSNNENILEEVNESLNELENLIEDILQKMSL